MPKPPKNQPTIPFHQWLTQMTRPLINASLIGLICLGLFVFTLNLNQNRRQANDALNNWKRTAELLIQKRDIDTLQGVTERLLVDYPRSYFELKKNKQTLWKFPLSSPFSFVQTWEWPIQSLPGLTAVAHIPVYSTYKTTIAISTLFGIFLLLIFLFFRKFYSLIADTLNAKVNALALGRLSGVQEMDALVQTVQAAAQASEKAESEAVLGRLAAQVSHDIRSPLASLAAIIHSTHGLDEKSRIMLRSAANRIQDIANQLLEKDKKNKINNTTSVTQLSSEELTIEPIALALDSTISQKRIQYQQEMELGLKFNTDYLKPYNIFAEIQPTEFSRMISNLINNAIEACLDCRTARLNIHLFESKQNVVIRIEDNGKGIPADLLSRLGQRGETHHKMGGTGLGLFHAKKTLETWGGRLEIQSQIGIGTTISLFLPQAAPPEWFVPEIHIQPFSKIIIVDDDPTIHQIWKKRFDAVTSNFLGLSLIHFENTQELLKWYQKTLGGDGLTIYLFDYEIIGSKQNGIEMIDMLGVAKQSILVTSHAEDISFRKKCEKFRVRIIPKEMAHLVPLVSKNSPNDRSQSSEPTYTARSTYTAR